MSDYQRTDQSALSSSRGWGKQAAQRLNTKDQFKNDPLLRTLEVQATSTACSTVCNHPWTKKPQIVDDAEERRKLNVLSILKIQIRTRQKSIAEYENRKKELYPFTSKRKNNIHGDVKSLLQKYERFRGAMSTLNKKFGDDLLITKKRLEETKTLVNKEIAELQQQLNVMDKKLMQKNEEMNILLNYKDKEYPAKALQIAKLKRQREILESTFKEELEELQAVVDAERDKFSQQRKTVQREITTRVTEDTINAMGEDV
ncbi:hypothetical protein OS493_033551 [Desmophyllum pertusum]|uniref:Uncharacterized protein n=1 Tax=Desmophyllum pertusum TaxID=174260 RepID=A0A9W9Z940_9CNID|nr:hypothetical protein OS493_033551 [Desmophyllum pertusum]